MSGVDSAGIAQALGIEVVDPTPTDGPIRLSELGNARRLVRDYGGIIRHCQHASGSGWLVWDGQRWARDWDGRVVRWAKALGEGFLAEAEELEQEAGLPKGEAEALEARVKALRSWARTSEKASTVRAVLEHLRTESAIPVEAGELDADPWVLGTPTGTVDLRTGRRRTALPAELVTKQTGVPWESDANCPAWERFLSEIMGGDEDLVGFLRRAAGYSAIGVLDEQVFLVLHGSGANGKSTLIETLRYVLGDYARACPPESFLARKTDGIRNDLARLPGIRLATAAETGEGKSLDEALVKGATGGEPITARFLHKEYFEFLPQFTLWLSTNHKPRVRGTDHGIWRRIRLVPFAQTFDGARRDPELGRKLRAEGAGILAWIARGALEWQERGLDAPAQVLAATAAYRSEQDVVAAFLEECCQVGPGVTVANPMVYRTFADWCRDTGEYVRSQRWLTQQLRSHGFEQRRTGSARLWQGIRVLPEAEPDATSRRW